MIIYMLDKAWDKIWEIIGIETFSDTKILIDTDDKLSDDMNLRNVVILMTYVIKYDGKFYPQTFLEEAFYNK